MHYYTLQLWLRNLVIEAKRCYTLTGILLNNGFKMLMNKIDIFFNPMQEKNIVFYNLWREYKILCREEDTFSILRALILFVTLTTIILFIYYLVNHQILHKTFNFMIFGICVIYITIYYYHAFILPMKKKIDPLLYLSFNKEKLIRKANLINNLAYSELSLLKNYLDFYLESNSVLSMRFIGIIPVFLSIVFFFLGSDIVVNDFLGTLLFIIFLLIFYVFPCYEIRKNFISKEILYLINNLDLFITNKEKKHISFNSVRYNFHHKNKIWNKK